MGNKLLIMEIARKVREVELWEVFSQLKEQKGVSIADIANATGLPYTTVDSIIKKKLKDIKYSNAQKIADYFGVSVEYLATGKKPDNVIEYDHNKLVYVPVVGESAAGYPIYADQQFEGMFPVDTRFVNLNGYNKDDFFYLRIKGNSMAPYIMDNDLVLVRRQSTVDNNELAVVLCDSDTATVKRVVFAGDKIILNSDNKEYHPQIYNADECRILGKVLHRFGAVK